MADTSISANPSWAEYAATLPADTNWHNYVVPDWVRVVIVSNTHGSNTLKVSRDKTDSAAYSSGGFTLAAGGSLSLNITGGQAQGSVGDRTIALRGSGNSTTFELLLLASA